jgi:pimeloyl-ACP methyl ester carboxylesterase
MLAAQDWAGPEDRTPILCLPGVTRSTEDFAPLAARHAATRRVLAFDHVGHGESARAATPARYRIEESLRDVLDGMAALHAPRVAIVGTSYGGILAMVLAVLRPTAIAGVVLNDIGPEIAPLGLDHVQNHVGRDPALESLDACVAHLQATLPPLTIDAAGWERFARSTFARGKDGRWHPRWDIRIAEAMRGGGAAPNLWPAFGALAHAPLLLLRGALSEMLPESTAQAMRRARPDMAFAEVPGTGHAPTLDEPVAIAAIDAFLDAIP